MVIDRLEEIEIADLRIVVLGIDGMDDLMILETCQRIITITIGMVLCQDIESLLMSIVLDKPLLFVSDILIFSYASCRLTLGDSGMPIVNPIVMAGPTS